ncbi:hypothetical protein [Rubinisphaera italica]|uniref:Uncharacterized protein n=1 Tax=Rubinisphaera italica TaxID=2527969 RepID=A0A5C5XPS6_9PLAN|nr:hypothetical protein [Rubinisphaera italica]TWT64403.1 hypothetical protein Pan54_51650 [Rubinisphaera italica]
MKTRGHQQIDVRSLEAVLPRIGTGGIATCTPAVREFLLESHFAVDSPTDEKVLIGTNALFALGPTRHSRHALRRMTSAEPTYRRYLLHTVLLAIKTLADDESVADTLERLDHLGIELLDALLAPGQPPMHPLDVPVWQAPDAITLLSKVVEQPLDIAVLQSGPVVPVGFNWLEWDTPPVAPAPAPWADVDPLTNPLQAVRHPFWGALIATLDACTGDYEWQSLILRGGRIRSQHRTIGKAEPVIESLWREELGLYPVPPLVVPEDIPFVPGKPLHWLQRSLDRLADAGIATESEGSWRLTDHFRTELMKDDEHMIAFEAVRQRSYRLATSAARITDIPSEVVAQ